MLSFWNVLFINLWFMVIIIGSTIYFAISTSKRLPESGFAGWLLILAAIQILILDGALDHTAGLSFSDFDVLMKIAQVRGGWLLVLSCQALGTAYLAIVIWTSIMMYMRRQSFRRWFALQWFAGAVVSVMDFVLSSAMLGFPILEALANTEFEQTLAYMIQGMTWFMTGIWIVYLYRSARVRNTFVNSKGGVSSARRGQELSKALVSTI